MKRSNISREDAPEKGGECRKFKKGREKVEGISCHCPEGPVSAGSDVTIPRFPIGVKEGTPPNAPSLLPSSCNHAFFSTIESLLPAQTR